jgi:hypothetical protein
MEIAKARPPAGLSYWTEKQSKSKAKLPAS